MDAKLQRRIQRYGWDAAAKNYDAAWRDNLTPAHNAMFDLVNLRPGETVLDVACGSGILTFSAASIVGGEGAVTATDISDEMVQTVTNLSGQQGLLQVRAYRMDAESMSLPFQTFARTKSPVQLSHWICESA
jgi:ubiquinone/menaquinone biosynthesis C-methylase UbiE